MTIHHATLAKAEKNGIVLNEIESTETGAKTYRAFWPQRNRTLVALTAKHALALMLLQKRFGDEYANIHVLPPLVNGDEAFTVARNGEEDTVLSEFTMDDFDEDAIFADTLEQMVEKGIEPSEFEDDSGYSGNIVPRRYREKYAAEGHPNHCGDWLANILIEECTAINDGGKPFFNIETFDAIYDENKGPRDQKWCRNTEGRGWQGRYRMSGRIALAKVVGINGYLVLNGTRLVPPTEWLAKHSQKPKTKKEKAQEEKAAA